MSSSSPAWLVPLGRRSTSMPLEVEVEHEDVDEVEEVKEEGEEGDGLVEGVGGMREAWGGRMVRGRGVTGMMVVVVAVAVMVVVVVVVVVAAVVVVSVASS